MELLSAFDYSSVYYSDNHDLNLLIQAKAPKLSIEGRTPVNLVACIDVSSSMAGRKMDFAKKSLLKLIDHLSPEDSLGIVSFHSNVETLFSPTKMTQENKDKMKAKVFTLNDRGATNFSGALLAGFKEASQVDGPCRVIMFTDGEPTVGDTSEDGILRILQEQRAKHMTVSCFGYGEHHGSKLLNDLSTQGKGNYSYIPGPDEALKAFALELGGLLSCYAQNLKFQVKPRSGVKIQEVVSDVEVKERSDNGVTISVPDIYSEETRNLVLKLTVDSKSKAFPRETSVLDVDLWFDDTRTGKSQKIEGAAKLKFVKHGEQQKKPNQEVVDQLGFALVAKGQIEANKMASSGNLAGAQAHIFNVQNVVADSGVSSNVLRSVEKSATYYADAGTYASTISDNYSSARGMSTGRLNLSATNSIQESVTKSFVDGAGSQSTFDTEKLKKQKEEENSSLTKTQTDNQW